MEENQKVSKKPYLVYMNKTYNVYLTDAYIWMKKYGYKEDDFEGIISEVVFHYKLGDSDGAGKYGLDDTPVMFVGKIYRDFDNQKRTPDKIWWVY